MSMHVSYFDAVFSYAQREMMLTECPAMALLCFQHMMGTLLAGGTLVDPLAKTGRQDALSPVLHARSPRELLRLLSDDATSPDEAGHELRRIFRDALRAAWTPICLAPHTASLTAGVLSQNITASTAPQLWLRTVAGRPRFVPTQPSAAADDVDGGVPTEQDVGLDRPLNATTLRNVLDTSRRFLRSVTTCALAGSLVALSERRHQALRSILLFTRLVPAAAGATAGRGEGGRPAAPVEVTPEGLNFCMLSLQQQWWVLVNGALDRVLALTEAAEGTSTPERVTRPLLWQLLAVLAGIEAERVLVAFPERDEDPAAHHLLARLAEIGLVYPVKVDGAKCFALSPHFRHAVEWQATAPLCLSMMLDSAPAAGAVDNEKTSSRVGGGAALDLRREDMDTIITETNFRLYAYTRSPDLLSILDQFAVREEEVEGVLVCYRVTRSSFARAVRKGITARQVLKFLSLRAHPSMLRHYGEAVRGAVDGAPDARTTTYSGGALAIPQSFCDQLFMWEVECNRVTFHKNLVLLRNMTPEQQTFLSHYLDEKGEVDAVVHREPGFMVIREEVYDRLLAPALTSQS